MVILREKTGDQGSLSVIFRQPQPELSTLFRQKTMG